MDRELAGIAITDDIMRAIETAAGAVERAARPAELASAHIELVAITDVEVRLDGDAKAIDGRRDVVLECQLAHRHRTAGSAACAGGAGSSGRRTHRPKLEAAQDIWRRRWRQARVADVAAARLLDERRRELIAAARG